jgi:hypothetical protein
MLGNEFSPKVETGFILTKSKRRRITDLIEPTNEKHPKSDFDRSTLFPQKFAFTPLPELAADFLVRTHVVEMSDKASLGLYIENKYFEAYSLISKEDKIQLTQQLQGTVFDANFNQVEEMIEDFSGPILRPKISEFRQFMVFIMLDVQ